MFKAVSFSALTLVSLSSILGAWGQRAPMDHPKESIDLRFPLNPNQGWALEESLLIWKTYEDDVDYAVRRTVNNPSSSLEEEQYRLKHPDFKWGTGVRVKLTRYLPSNDPWDVDFIGTYYYNEGKGHTNLDSASDTASLLDHASSTWDTKGSPIAESAHASTRMNFFTFDLITGRYYSLTKKVDIHPFIGLRTALNYQQYKTTYSSTLALGSEPLSKTSFNGDHSFWGIGPRIGTDLALKFGRHWSFLATLAGSLFVGRYDIQETFHGKIRLSQTPVPYRERLEDKDTVLRSNIDASLGLGWEKWVRGGTVRIAPSFVFEVSEWFSMKRWTNTHNADSTFTAGMQPRIQTHRRYSDLGLMGFNVNLQIDF